MIPIFSWSRSITEGRRMIQIFNWSRSISANGPQSPVFSVYITGGLTDGHPVEKIHQKLIQQFDDELASIKFDPEMIYEICFAKQQEEHLGAVAQKHGFVRVCLTRNPKTTNRIAVYIRHPNIDL